MCTANVTGYVCNSNGFLVRSQTTLEYTSGNLSEGTIAGITIGWMLVATALYLIGLWVIFYLFKNRFRERKE